jgi:hypothetical protein
MKSPVDKATQPSFVNGLAHKAFISNVAGQLFATSKLTKNLCVCSSY